MIQKVFLSELPSSAKFFAEATIGVYLFNGQLIRLIEEGGLYYRQINGGAWQMISQSRFQSLWDRHQKLRIVQTVYFCDRPQVKIFCYHACLEGLIVAKGTKIPADWPRLVNVDFQKYEKNIPEIREWKDLLF